MPSAPSALTPYRGTAAATTLGRSASRLHQLGARALRLERAAWSGGVRQSSCSGLGRQTTANPADATAAVFALMVSSVNVVSLKHERTSTSLEL